MMAVLLGRTFSKGALLLFHLVWYLRIPNRFKLRLFGVLLSHQQKVIVFSNRTEMSTEWICHCIQVTFTVHWLTSRVDEHSSESDIRYNSNPMEMLPNSRYSQFSRRISDLVLFICKDTTTSLHKNITLLFWFILFNFSISISAYFFLICTKIGDKV